MIRKALSHASLLFIAAGAISIFLSNILLKETLSATDFGRFSLVVTYLSLMYIFGNLGFEQVIVRLTRNPQKNVIALQRVQLYAMVAFSLISSVIGTVFFATAYGEIRINPALLFIGTLGIVGVMPVFTFLRLNSDFVLAQTIANLWKICLLALSFVYFKWYREFSLSSALMLSIAVIFVAALLVLWRRLHFEFNTEFTALEVGHYFVQFFFSILIFTFLTFGDRLLINHIFGNADFGNYFYLSTFYLAPFSILQNYVGFKHTIGFKTASDLSVLTSLLKNIIVYGLLFTGLLASATLAIQTFHLLSFDFSQYKFIIAILLLTGLSKLFYAAIGSFLEANADSTTLKKLNFFFFLFLVIVLMIGWQIGIPSISALILVVFSIWVARCIFYWVMLRRFWKVQLPRPPKDLQHC